MCFVSKSSHLVEYLRFKGVMHFIIELKNQLSSPTRIKDVEHGDRDQLAEKGTYICGNDNHEHGKVNDHLKRANEANHVAVCSHKKEPEQEVCDQDNFTTTRSSIC